MSTLGLTDDLRDDDTFVAALLGLRSALSRCEQWQATLDATHAAGAGAQADDHFVDCLLGISALAAKLEPVLREWASKPPAAAPEEVRPESRAWRDMLR